MEDNFDFIEKNYSRMIYKLANKWKNEPRVPYDDLVAEGQMAALRAIETFDKNKAKLSTYMYTCINNAIISYFQKNNWTLKTPVSAQRADLESVLRQQKSVISTNRLNDSDDGNMPFSIPSSDNNPVKIVSIEEQKKILYDAIFSLDKRESYILLNGRNWLGTKTVKEISDELGVTSQWIYKIGAGACKKLKHKISLEV